MGDTDPTIIRQICLEALKLTLNAPPGTTLSRAIDQLQQALANRHETRGHCRPVWLRYPGQNC